MENQSTPSTSSLGLCDTKGTVMSLENTKAGHKEKEKAMKVEQESSNNDKKEGNKIKKGEITSMMITNSTENENKKGNERNVVSASSTQEQQEQKQQSNGGATTTTTSTTDAKEGNTQIQARKKRLINPSSMLPLRAALAELQKQKLRDSSNNNNNNNKYYSPASTLLSYSSQKKRRQSDYGSDGGGIAIKPLQNRNNDTRDKVNPNYAHKDERGIKNKGIEKRMERDEHIHTKEKRRKKGDGRWDDDDVREALERKTVIYDKLHKQNSNEEEKEGRKHDVYEITSQADPRQENKSKNEQEDKKYLVDFRRKKEREHTGEKRRRRRMDESTGEEWSRDRFHSKETSNHGHYQYWDSHPWRVQPPPFRNDYDTYKSSRSWHGGGGGNSGGNRSTSHHQCLQDDNYHHHHHEQQQRQRQDEPHYNHGRRRRTQDREATNYFVHGPRMVEIRDEFGRLIRVPEDGTQYRTHLAEQARKARVEEIWRSRHDDEEQQYGKRTRGERDAYKRVDSMKGYGPRSGNGGRNDNDDDDDYYCSVRSETKVDNHCDGMDNKNNHDGDKTERKPMDFGSKKEARLELLRKKQEARERR